MTRSRVTLRDVARHVGVHASTVSRVLNPETRGMVTAEIARRVTEAAAALGYRPNPFAYSLKTKRSFTVGVLVPDLTNPVFPPIIRGIEAVLEQAGYTAILANCDGHPQRERVALEKMKARQVDGLILATARREDPLVAECLAERIPLVLINRTVDRADAPAVVNDDAAGIRLAVEHVAALGHRRIAHVAGPSHLSTGHRRHLGFLAALRALGLEPDPRRIEVCQAFSEAEGRRALEALFARGADCTAVVAANDLLALGCYDALEARGLRCPEHLSVTGFNDMPLLGKLRPPLTAVRIPLHEMGERAAQMLLAQVQEPGMPVHPVLLAPTLIVRGSTGPAPTG